MDSGILFPARETRDIHKHVTSVCSVNDRNKLLAAIMCYGNGKSVDILFLVSLSYLRFYQNLNPQATSINQLDALYMYALKGLNPMFRKKCIFKDIFRVKKLICEI